MTILNFTVAFAEAKILANEKQRSMRPVRDNPNSVWNRLYQKFQKETKHNQRSMFDYSPYPKEPEDQQMYPMIKLQLWMNQRSRYYWCDCHKTKVLQKDLGKCCEYCMTLAVHKEAHHLADAVLTNMTKRTLGSLSEDEWKADGFEPTLLNNDVKDVGLRWFAKTYDLEIMDNTPSPKIGDFEVYIIEFKRVG
jgi:hypothetical protein